MSKKVTTHLNRRTFLAASAATGLTIVRASQVRGTEANSKIEIGLIGCGGRGRWIARLFAKHGGYKIVAVADYFQVQADFVGDQQKVPADRRYTSLSAYKQLIDSKLDAVIVESPPYFHPIHAAAAVAANKHVYLAKPIAVDVPGCLTIGESSEKAAQKERVFLVDFQTRANPIFQEAVKRVHEGQIGKLICGEARYPWAADPSKPHATPEDRLRYWYGLTALSGDFIVEQSIHSIDVATWIANGDPIEASAYHVKGKCGRHGDISDSFNVLYLWPNDFAVSFTCVQAVPGVVDTIACRAYGSEGVIDTDYFKDVNIKGKKPYAGGTMNNLYTEGAETNIATFHRCVMKGDYSNPTTAPSVRSNLTAILGRNAAYEGKKLNWKEFIKSDVRLEPDLSGLKS